MSEEQLFCSDNITNSSLALTENSGLAELPILVAGCIVFLLVLPFVIFEFGFFPLGTTAAVILGACLMVICQVVGQDEAYQVIGQRANLTTIFLLLGMMLLTQYFDRENLFDRVLQKFLKKEYSFNNYVWRVALLAFVLAAFFTNDATCAIITPLMLSFWKTQDRPFLEVETLLLAIPTSANLGSVTTIFGNAQMALIAARTSTPLYQESMLDLRTSLMYLGPPAVLGYFLNIGFLMLHYKVKQMYNKKRAADTDTSSDDQDIPALTVTELNTLKNIQTDTDIMDKNSSGEAVEIAPLPSKFKKASFDVNAMEQKSKRRQSALQNIEEYGRMIRRKSGISPADFQTDSSTDSPLKAALFTPSGSIAFQVILCVLTLAVVALNLASTKAMRFDVGLVPLSAAIFVLTFDALVNRNDALVILKRVDWSILMMFFGLFVWMYGLNKTHLPHFVWDKIGMAGTTVLTPLKILILCVFIVVGSNIFSNVPLTIIVLQQLEPCKNQLGIVILLGWAATVAGNLTLFGSVANLIVMQKGIQTVDYRLTFLGYLKFGLLSTVVIVTLGILVIYGLLQI